MTESTHNFFEGNYYLGRFEKLPEDGKACQSAEIYQQEVLAKDENGYQGLALLMDTVEVTGVKGVLAGVCLTIIRTRILVAVTGSVTMA